jgi:hypothetical protein
MLDGFFLLNSLLILYRNKSRLNIFFSFANHISTFVIGIFQVVVYQSNVQNPQENRKSEIPIYNVSDKLVNREHGKERDCSSERFLSIENVLRNSTNR